MSDRFTEASAAGAYGDALYAHAVGDGSQRVDRTFTLDKQRTVTLWVRAYGPSEASDGFYAGFNGNMFRRNPPVGAWTWVEVTTATLAAGQHTVHLGPGEVGVWLDMLVVTDAGLTASQIDARLGGPPGGGVPSGPPGGGGPGPGPSEGVFDLAVNPNFNDSNRVLKDGTPFTSTMNQIYDGLINSYVDGTYIKSGSNADLRMETRLTDGSSYQVGRNVFRQMQSLMLYFRLTGDIRLLDELTRWGKLVTLRTTWHPNSPIWSTSHEDHRQPHGKTFMANYLSPSTGYWWGNDYHLTDTVRGMRPFAQLGHALDVNRARVSPKGHSYASEADRWKGIFQDYEAVWSKVNDSQFASNMRVPSIYKGQWQPGGAGNIRAALNDWPVNYRSLTHTNHGAGMNSLYMGRLIDKASVGLSGMRRMMDPFFEDEVLYTMVSGREHAFWGRAYGSWTSSSYYGHPITYAEYTLLDVLDLHMDNARPEYDLVRFLRGAANSFAHWVINGSDPASFTLDADIQGNATRTGTSPSGRTATVESAIAHTSFGPTYTRQEAGWNASGVIMAFDASGRMRSMLDAAWKSYYGSYADPRSLAVPLGVFIDEAGIYS